MKWTSIVAATMSGSVGGCTASHNRGGQYLRRRAMPVNPGSAFAQIITGALASLVARWSGVLTQAQRDAWDALAFGGILTGPNAFVRNNSIRIQAGLTIIDDPPITNDLAALTPPVLTLADESTQRFTVTFDANDPWASGGDLAMFASRPQAATINYFKGPYRFVELINGAPPVSPFQTTAGNTPFPFLAGQKVFVQFRALQTDGRISSPIRSAIVAVP